MATYDKRIKTVNHEQYHQCQCYGHETEVPDYKHDIAVPKTLQGYYAKQGGCTCFAGECWCGGPTKDRRCVAKGQTPVEAGPTEAKRIYTEKDGPHPVYPQSGPDLPRDPVTGVRTTFPNRRNYGGTVADRGPTTLTTACQAVKNKQTKAEKQMERDQNRKQFLKAVLRDEMLARMDAEDQRSGLEQELGLLGGNHVVDYANEHGQHSLTGADPRRGMERGTQDVPTVADQYDEVMDELRFTAAQPVGSKFNIIRLHYLCEEEDRISRLRFDEKVQQRTLANKKHAK